MYDINRTGYLTKDEMSQIMESFYKLVGPLVTFSGKKYESSQQLVDEFFEQADSDGDGKISLDDYRAAAVKNPDIIQGLRLFA